MRSSALVAMPRHPPLKKPITAVRTSQGSSHATASRLFSSVVGNGSPDSTAPTIALETRNASRHEQSQPPCKPAAGMSPVLRRCLRIHVASVLRSIRPLIGPPTFALLARETC
jgi:hypothetical protein